MKPISQDQVLPSAHALNQAGMYDAIDRYIAEIYDQCETQRDDINLISFLIGDQRRRILEPFCGNGRILIPLAQSGHEIAGLDLSVELLQSLADRLRQLPAEVQVRASFSHSDVIADAWPDGFDVVILGGNCFYELATPEEQEHCVQAAAGALKPGGHLYLDNDHMEGDLDLSWRNPAILENKFPTGICSDGARVHGTMETIWFDAPRRLVQFRRTATLLKPDGTVQRKEWIQQKHPPSTEEMTTWLIRHGFKIEHVWGDRMHAHYTNESERVIFWARKAF